MLGNIQKVINIKYLVSVISQENFYGPNHCNNKSAEENIKNTR